jgi:HK97 family phage prohead protease
MFKEYSEQIAKEIKEKMISFEIKSVEENGTFKVIASDETVDRAGEVIKVDGWDFKNYMKNPIMLFWHDYRSIEAIAWKATNIYVEGKKLIVEGVFASTEKAQMLRQLYDEGIIKTVSVGFIPKERDTNDQKVITKAELLEVSFVPIPANPNALSIQKEMLEKMVEFGIVKGEETEEKKPEEETPVVVEETTEEKVLKMFAEIKSMIIDIPNQIKAITKEVETSDDKDDLPDDKDKDEKIQMQKEALQKVSKVVSDALHKIKL